MEHAADLVAELARALLDEEHARTELGAALDRQADLLRQLRAEGLPLPAIASRVLRCRGLVLPIAQRLKVAERLRKRAARRTVRPLNLVGAHGLEASPASLCGRAIKPEKPEIDMAKKLVRRTVTEEFVQDEIDEEADEVEIDEPEEEAQENEADAPAQPRRRRRR